MKNTYTQSSDVSKKVVAGLLVAGQVMTSAEEAKSEAVETLAETTLIATKFEKQLSDVSQSVEVMDKESINLVGGTSLLNAISYRVSGVAIFNSAGQRGNVGNLHIRGTENDHSQIRLDGVRIHSGTGGLNNFIGNSSVAGLSSVEILKGGGIYGSSAIGGVVSLSTSRGEGEPSHQLFTEYGSFDTFVGTFSSQGRVGDFSYNVGINGEDSKNDPVAPVDGNDFNKFGYFGRFDYDLTNGGTVGFTFRGIDTRYENAYSVNVDVPNNLTEVQNYDALFSTIFYDHQVSDKYQLRLTLGYGVEDIDVHAPNGNDSRTNTDRYSISFDSQYAWSANHESSFGAYFEELEYEALSSFGGGAVSFGSSEDRDTYGVFFNHNWDVSDLLQLNGTVAWDDHDNFGDQVTWNTGAVVHLTDVTRFKANIGTAYRAPSILDLNPQFGAAVDPDIEAEESQNWDVSLEQEIASTLIKLTWFENNVENAIENPTFVFVTNLPGKSKANGLELSAESVIDSLDARLYVSYTYLQNQLTQALPQQVASVEFSKTFAENLDASIVATWVDERELGEVLDDYTLVNAQLKYAHNENLLFHVRVENLLDESYLVGDFSSFGETPINARGRGIYGGLTVTF